jgi:chemotaxis response regulator CheB
MTLKPSQPVRQPAEEAWVLTGGLGAVPAAQRFFRSLAPEVAGSCAFVVAIDAPVEAIGLLARLLARVTPGAVHAAGVERSLYPGDVLVLALDEEATTRECVLRALISRYGERLGVIALSGIVPDGAEACRAVIRAGGRVWVQDARSARYTALPRSIARACNVTFSAAPEGLAAALAGGAPRPPVAALPFTRREMPRLS